MNDVSDAEFSYIKPFNDFQDIGWYKKEKKEYVKKDYVSKHNVNKLKEFFDGPLTSHVQGNLRHKIMNHTFTEDYVLNNDKNKYPEDSVMKNSMTNELECPLKYDNKNTSQNITSSVMKNDMTNELQFTLKDNKKYASEYITGDINTQIPFKPTIVSMKATKKPEQKKITESKLDNKVLNNFHQKEDKKHAFEDITGDTSIKFNNALNQKNP